MNKRAVISVICLSCFLSACTENSNGINTQIESLLKTDDLTLPINLALVSSSSWERICILPPYTNNERAEQILGFKWDAESKTSIANNEGVNVLVFVKGHEAIDYTEYPRNKGDFSEIRPPCLTREQATVVRKSGRDGWVFLVTHQ